MAGARLEATYGPDCIHIWFTAYADFLISWDPFYYNIDIGISVGAAFPSRSASSAASTSTSRVARRVLHYPDRRCMAKSPWTWPSPP